MNDFDLTARGKSLVNVVPRGNNVLLRIEFNVSLMSLMSDKPDPKSEEKVTFHVAGFGPLVKNLNLNEEVMFSIEAGYRDIPVEGNERSIRALKKHYSELPKMELNALMQNKDTQTVKVVQYGMFVEYLIYGHFQTIV